MTAQGCVLVLLGGSLGGVARLLVGEAVTRVAGGALPWGTLTVNVSGALVIGMTAGLARTGGGILSGEAARDFLAVGLCGGYTTVSSFSLQTLALSLEGEGWRAALYVGLSAILSVAAVAAGYAAGAAA